MNRLRRGLELRSSRSTTGRSDDTQSRSVLAIRRLLRNRMAALGLLLLAVLVSVTAIAPWIAPSSPTSVATELSVRPPSREHLLGTDSLGRDILSRIMFGGRISLGVGLVAVALACLVGIPFGIVAGYFGRSIDNVLMRFMDTIMSFPSLVLAIAIIGSLGPSIRNLILTLGLVYSPLFARVVRATTLAARAEEYVTAARAIGATNWSILVRHILPNLSGPLVVQATVIFSWAIIAEASLSFLGLGAQPPTPSWGQDLSEGRQYIDQASWIALSPALVIVMTVLASNFLGDGLRDAFDPRHR